VQDGDAVAGVVQRQREIDHVVARLHRAAAAGHDHSVAVDDVDLLGRVLQPGRHQQWTQPRQQRALRRAGGAVRRTERRERRDRKDQRPVCGKASAETVTQSITRPGCQLRRSAGAG